MNEHHLQTTRTARYYTSGILSAQTQEVWMVLHGYAQLAKDLIQPFEAIASEQRVIIAPEGLNRFYAKGFGGRPAAAWMTSEDRLNEIRDYINYLDVLYQSLHLDQSQAKVILLGFSQGVATASRWFHATSFRVDQFVIYAGEIASELQSPLSDKIRNTALTYITGTNDPMITAEKRTQVTQWMKSLNARIIEFDGGHEVKEEVLLELTARG